jgi:glycerophosphoryl diester phosphodiesterase
MVTQDQNPLRSRVRTLPVLNIAHRGARAFGPENALAAFEKAKELGCDMVELDVHMSKDHRLVVHHDDQLTRDTNVKARFPGRDAYFVSDFTWEELQTLDAGSWFAEQLSMPAGRRQAFLQSLTGAEMDQFITRREREFFASGEVRIPSLQEMLELAARTETMVNIELKTLPRMYPGLAEAVMTLVENLRLEPGVLISSFDHEQLLEVRRHSAVIATAVLTSDRLAKPGEYLKLLDADAYHPGCYGNYDSLGFGSVSGKLDPRGIVEARAVGRGVNVWTCNDKDRMRQLIAAGATGLISDFPNRVRDILNEPR